MYDSMEISNVGIDIVNIQRFRKKEYIKNKKFYEKIFSDSEINYCLSFKNNSISEIIFLVVASRSLLF